MRFNCEQTRSCFMGSKLWKPRAWTQLIVVIKYNLQQSSYLPISIHNCYCVAWSLCINCTWCICCYYSYRQTTFEFFQFFLSCFLFLVSLAFIHMKERWTGRREAWPGSSGKRSRRHFRRGKMNGNAWGTLLWYRGPAVGETEESVFSLLSKEDTWELL